MKPTIGRVVHYERGHGNTGRLGSATCAALITGVNPDGTCNLHIFPDHGGGDTWLSSIAHAEQPTYGCWTWPPREPQDNRPQPVNESPKAIAMPVPQETFARTHMMLPAQSTGTVGAGGGPGAA